jgi:hypothetical protein
MLIFYRFGVLYFVGIFEIFSPDFYNENWKWCLALCVLPIIITTIFTFIYFEESPKMHMSKNNLEEAEQTIAKLAALSINRIDSSDIVKLREEYKANYKTNESTFDLSIILSTKYRTITFLCAIIVLSSSMINVCNMYSLPIMLTKNEHYHQGHQGLALRVLIPQIVVIPGILFSVTSCKYLGRKFTIIIGFVSCFISSLVSSIYCEGIIISLALINFFNIISICGIKMYVIEFFPTHSRDHAVALCYFGARLGDSLCPLLCNMSFKIYSYGSMLIINILCCFGSICSILLPFDTLGTSIE